MAFHSAKVASAVMISRGIKVFTNLQRLVYQHSDGDAKETIKRVQAIVSPSLFFSSSPHIHMPILAFLIASVPRSLVVHCILE